MQPNSLPSGALRLADWGLIRAEGPDAASFLHGQLTQDVTHLAEGQARLAGYCSAKGRLLATFVIWRSGKETLQLACSGDLLASTLKRLSMFVLRAKCKLVDASQSHALYGLVGDAATAWLGNGAPLAPWAVRVSSATQGASDGSGSTQVLRLPDAEGQARYLLVQSADAAPPDLPLLEADHWQWLEVRSGIARITAATADHFVPQMVNLELVGGVNFQKGCYPGQEVVARSQYRGTLKRRTVLFDADVPVHAGQEVFHSDDPGQPAGMVANAATRPGGGMSALVEVKLAALVQGTLHAGSPDGASLLRAPLPYDIPSDAA
ncbi:folate-binding protein YgfZ [Ideonella sp. A 288]|uniref:CAF17-like 4Fe-4S cluster assembly/insertion protein YgfZ n=1 Tax=Ideonella sp. A 288 TaxID=1962181 RepID=UPI000B4BE008|nr:folate-binding protein YgfZ [Ideonella sp. A 288]